MVNCMKCNNRNICGDKTRDTNPEECPFFEVRESTRFETFKEDELKNIFSWALKGSNGDDEKLIKELQEELTWRRKKRELEEGS